MTATRITAAEYQQCVDHGACKAVPSSPWCNTTEPTRPATCVSFPEAARFCGWVGARLPTSVEWESLADRGFDLHAGEGVDDAHGATEWVVGEGRAAGFEEVRGGVGDLEPLRRCAWGNARRSSETGQLGFRCVRATPPPAFPRWPRDVKRTLRGFELAEGRVVLDVRLSTEELAQTFVGCRSSVLPLGEYVAPHTRETEWGPATRHAYATPCSDVVFVITAADVRAAPLPHLAKGPRAAAKAEACRVVSGAECKARPTGDLDGDGVVDFFVESRDVCRSGALVLSAGASWRVVAQGALWCPD